MTTILTWPIQWARAEQVQFYLQTFSLSSQRWQTKTASVYGPVSQVWVCEITSIPIPDEREVRRMRAWISRVAGTSGLIRRGDPTRSKPFRNSEAFRDYAASATTTWGDGTTWSDGTLWADAALPSSATIGEAAARGATSLLLTGLPAGPFDDGLPAFFAGDLVEVRPNGAPVDHGHLYEVTIDAHCDATGATRITLTNPLRAGVAAGDQVVIEDATSVFRLADADQGIAQMEAPMIGRIGAKLVEVIP